MFPVVETRQRDSSQDPIIQGHTFREELEIANDQFQDDEEDDTDDDGFADTTDDDDDDDEDEYDEVEEEELLLRVSDSGQGSDCDEEKAEDYWLIAVEILEVVEYFEDTPEDGESWRGNVGYWWKLNREEVGYKVETGGGWDEPSTMMTERRSARWRRQGRWGWANFCSSFSSPSSCSA
ncbi:hypothetical protein Q3G72_028419 [Acer saccharum]|nr:hypothetical protein Q3G72_028419 [Acer saccharum]